MPRKERETDRQETLTNSNRIILIIDDEPKNMEYVAEEISNVDGLQAKLMHPNALPKITTDELERTVLILADQFLHHWEPMDKTREFLQKVKLINSKAEIIEISYHLQPSVYKDSIGTIDTFNLIGDVRDEMEKWPKNPEIFLTKLKWKSNYAFKEADKADRVEDNDEDIITSFGRVRRIFEKLTKDKNFPKLLSVLDVSEDEFIGSFMADNNLSRRKEILHSSWQTIGHIVCGNSEDFYAMSAQRLKETIKSSEEN